MRLFVGIPLALGVTSELAALVERLKHELRSGASGLRWMPPESWHITLQFLGNTDEAHYNCLTARLSELRAAPVPVRIEELGAFERVGVLFADVAATPELASLARRVTDFTARCGFAPEERPFHPHITLGRARSRGNPLRGIDNQEQHPKFSRFVASEFLLYESQTEREGARYVVRGRFPLD